MPAQRSTISERHDRGRPAHALNDRAPVMLERREALSVGGVLALQAAAGNRAVAARIARAPAVISNRKPRIPAPGPLGLQEEDDAIEAGNGRFDDVSIRGIQALVGTHPTGVLGPEDAQAIAVFKRAHGAGLSGVVSQKALDSLVVEATRSDMHDEAIHLVVDFFRLGTTRSALSIRFDPRLPQVADVMFEGPLQVIGIGLGAFKSAAALRAAIAAQLDTPNPLAVAQPPPVFVRGMPHRLTPWQVDDAVAFNRVRLRDPRAVLALQVVVGADLSGAMDVQTAEFIAQRQSVAQLPSDGKVDRPTFLEVFDGAVTLKHFNAAIRLAVDYHRLESAAVLDVVFDDAVADACETRGTGTGAPVTLAFGPVLFLSFLPAADTIHQIANFFEQARLREKGGAGAHPDARTFLGAAVEILSRGMAEEAFVSPAGGFIDDAETALLAFKRMLPEDRNAFWSRFEEVREKVRERFRSADPADRHANETLLRGYEAIARTQ